MTKKLPNVSATVLLIKNGIVTGRSSKKRTIYRRSENHGVIINDGREVYKGEDGHWYYEPM